MGCNEYHSWVWGNWHLINLIFWLVLFGGLGFIVYRIVQNGRGNAAIGLRTNILQNRAKCPNCKAAIEETYLCCPECHYKLKSNCPGCGKVVKTSWDICPYCETELSIQNEKIIEQI